MNANALAAIATLAERYAQTRGTSQRLCEPLAVEDYIVQSMPDASPTRWHLAHTTWFFDTFVLAEFEPNYRPVRGEYRYLFNSYYESLGPQFPRAERGVLTRPTVAEVLDYRRAVDERVQRLLASDASAGHRGAELASVVEMGMHHEQQHQELILTDIKHAFSCNPLLPAYRPAAGGSNGRAGATAVPVVRPPAPRDVRFAGGLVEIGHAGDTFSFDNERPRHKVYLAPFELGDRLVTNREYLAFIDDGGYRRAEVWLSLGWATVREQQWQAPLYWQCRDGRWHEFTLGGMAPLCEDAPVCHVSYFEADAFARWSGARLPTEFEWEHVAAEQPLAGGFLDGGRFHPAPAVAGRSGAAPHVRQLFGELWQWTASSYAAYPGYRPPAGALGEYNGKFMCNQYVLRGGSCATPANHLRPTYRNFFPPQARWQFSGIRLARD